MCTQKFKKIEAEIISRNEQIMSKSVVLILLSTVTKNTFTVSGFFFVYFKFLPLDTGTPHTRRSSHTSSIVSEFKTIISVESKWEWL